MPAKSEDRVQSYGEIRQPLDIYAFKNLIRDLNILHVSDPSSEGLCDAHVQEARLEQFAASVNQQLDDYLTKRRTYVTDNPNRGRRRPINYADEIEKTAKKLRTLILEAPPAISDWDEIQRLESLLEQVPAVMTGLRAADKEIEGGLGVINASAHNERGLRNILIHSLYALFREYSAETTWYTSNPSPDENEERYSTAFFQILRHCYALVGLNLADPTIESDITKAIAAGNLENLTRMSE